MSDAVRSRLAEARLYLCTDARTRQGDLEEFLDAALRGGVDVVQLREKGLEAAAEIGHAEVFASVAARHGALWSVNDRADVALATDAPVLHLGQEDLPVGWARTILGPSTVLGLSTHDTDQVKTAMVAPGVDYFCVGPCWATPTKQGRPAAGPPLVAYAAARATPFADGASGRPWFAIGGIDLGRLPEVIAAGARRVVVVRAITEADDPEEAARALRRQLVEAGPVLPAPSGDAPCDT